jgi:hypothetical protein
VPKRQKAETLIMTDTPIYRFRFVHDPGTSFEECNGETRPLTEDEYQENVYRACPNHWRAGSAVIDYSTTPPTVGCAVCGNTEYADIPYDEYLAYYGNPDAHIYLGCEVEKQCPCCSEWSDVDSVWGIDFMQDSPEVKAIDRFGLGEWLTLAEVYALPGYAREVATGLIP